MKISKKTRAQAVTLCLLRADHWIRSPGRPQWGVGNEFRSIGASQESIDLFWNVFIAVGLGPDLPSRADEYLEATALLRDGWCPGDRVKRLSK